MSEWQPIETANLSAMFGRSQWVLIATDLYRVTEAMPFFNDDGLCWWLTARGGNCADRRYPHSMLRETATHWMPLPSPPEPLND